MAFECQTYDDESVTVKPEGDEFARNNRSSELSEEAFESGRRDRHEEPGLLGTPWMCLSESDVISDGREERHRRVSYKLAIRISFRNRRSASRLACATPGWRGGHCRRRTE